MQIPSRARSARLHPKSYSRPSVVKSASSGAENQKTNGEHRNVEGVPRARLFVLRSTMGVRAIFLLGFMGSGKSSVGQELARRLRWDFLDLDARIEYRERRTIPEIFRDNGEPGFRLVETTALCELTESLERDTVVALGGGAFAQEKNRALILHWPTVFLEAPVDELWRRSSEEEDTRPLRKD